MPNGECAWVLRRRALAWRSKPYHTPGGETGGYGVGIAEAAELNEAIAEFSYGVPEALDLVDGRFDDSETRERAERLMKALEAALI